MMVDPDFILDKFDRQGRALARLRKGVVTATAPLTVEIGGSNVPNAGVKRLASYAPTIGDDVMLLTSNRDVLVLGKIA